MVTVQDIAKYASKHDACKPGLKRILKSKSDAELIALYKRNIDFCLDNDFPEKNLLKGFQKAGIYVDESSEVTNTGFVVLLGKSNASIQLTGYNVMQLFVKNESTANVNVSGNAYAVIDCFDDTDLAVSALDKSKVLVNVYGNSRVVSTGNVRVINKGKERY